MRKFLRKYWYVCLPCTLVIMVYGGYFASSLSKGPTEFGYAYMKLANFKLDQYGVDRQRVRVVGFVVDGAHTCNFWTFEAARKGCVTVNVSIADYKDTDQVMAKQTASRLLQDLGKPCVAIKDLPNAATAMVSKDDAMHWQQRAGFVGQQLEADFGCGRVHQSFQFVVQVTTGRQVIREGGGSSAYSVEVMSFKTQGEI